VEGGAQSFSDYQSWKSNRLSLRARGKGVYIAQRNLRIHKGCHGITLYLVTTPLLNLLLSRSSTSCRLHLRHLYKNNSPHPICHMRCHSRFLHSIGVELKVLELLAKRYGIAYLSLPKSSRYPSPSAPAREKSNGLRRRGGSLLLSIFSTRSLMFSSYSDFYSLCCKYPMLRWFIIY
jgi:hypothetical protein